MIWLTLQFLRQAMIIFLSSLLYTLTSLICAGFSLKQGFKSTSSLLMMTVVIFPIALFLSFFVHPSLSFSEYPIYVSIFLFAGLGLGLSSIFNQSNNAQQIRSAHHSSVDTSIVVYASSCVIALLVYLVTSSAAFNADEFRQRLALTETEVFDASETLIDAQQGRYIDQNLAFKTAQTMLSKRLGLGSRYEFDELRIQSVNSQLYWVAPLVNKSLIKWFNNSESPGYVMVSATDINDAALVLDKFPIRYGDSGFYGFDNIKRYLFNSGYAQVRFGAPALELRDEDLKPYWVLPVLHSVIGVKGLDVKSVVMLDATTGEFEEFSPEQAPDWIDRIYPQDIFASQVDDWGTYIAGWLNAVFIGDNVIRATPGTLFTYTSDGQGVWYTGVQSDGSSQEGTMGFVMGNSRTGKAIFYRRQGLTESVAQTVMEGAVQEAGYKASSPQPYNVDGVTTYVSILKDSSGNRQGYGMVAYNNRDIFATGTTPEVARRAFLNKLLSNQNGADLAQAGRSQITIRAKIKRIAVLTDSVLFLIESDETNLDKTIFSVPRETNFEAPLTAAEDFVILRYSPVDTSPQPITCFDNIDIGEDLCKIPNE
jgi:hypothetical protein